MRLEGKVALITRAGRAIGIATALRFAREGAIVVLNDVVSTHLDRVATEIEEDEGGRTLIALTKTLALECARDGITVNCVVSGVTASTSVASDAMAEPTMPAIPMGRSADPREIAAAHVFFASDEAAYVTGQVLYVDGGLSVSD